MVLYSTVKNPLSSQQHQHPKKPMSYSTLGYHIGVCTSATRHLGQLSVSQTINLHLLSPVHDHQAGRAAPFLYQVLPLWSWPRKYSSCLLHCNENSTYLFLFWEQRSLSTNFHIHVSVSNLYSPLISLHISSSRVGRPIVGIYKSLTDA